MPPGVAVTELLTPLMLRHLPTAGGDDDDEEARQGDAEMWFETSSLICSPAAPALEFELGLQEPFRLGIESERCI
jgi:hypothetical protein